MSIHLCANQTLPVAAQQVPLDALHTDPQRVQATGMSMGGDGTWEAALMPPRRFAAIATANK